MEQLRRDESLVVPVNRLEGLHNSEVVALEQLNFYGLDLFNKLNLSGKQLGETRLDIFRKQLRQGTRKLSLMFLGTAFLVLLRQSLG